jgi:hypothetical protein
VRIHDCHGAMVTVDPDNGESLQALRDGLGGLSVA